MISGDSVGCNNESTPVVTPLPARSEPKSLFLLDICVVENDPHPFELATDDNGDGVVTPPPLTPVFGNGSGTKNAASMTSARPELL
jgi:hypothetical protein